VSTWLGDFLGIMNIASARQCFWTFCTRHRHGWRISATTSAHGKGLVGHASGGLNRGVAVSSLVTSSSWRLPVTSRHLPDKII